MTTIREVARFVLPQLVGRPCASCEDFAAALNGLLSLYPDAVLMCGPETPADTVRIGVPVEESDAP